MSEAQEQAALFRWLALHSSKHPELDLIFHIPNGGLRSKITASRLKAQGVKRGVPDIFVPIPKNEYHGLFIELKVDGRKTSKYQKHYIDRLIDQGYSVEVSYGWVDAACDICDYLGLEGLIDRSAL